MPLIRSPYRACMLAVLCAALATTVACAGLQAQSSQSAATASRPTANQSYTYPGYELWDAAKWGGNTVKADPIANWIMANEKGTHAEYVVPQKYKGISDFVGHPDYTWKTESLADPEVMQPLARMGLRVDVREGGGFQIFVAPEKVLADKELKVPIIVVPHVVDKHDVYWAMNTLTHFKRYNELCAQRGDFILLYVVVDKAEMERAEPFGAIDLASDYYRGDYKRLYLDMSVFADNGAKVSSVAGLDWSGDDGKQRNPDAEIEHVGTIPVLNMAGMWKAKNPMGIGLARPRKDLQYDPQRIVHGMLGAHLMEGVSFYYSHGKDNDPAIAQHFERMGLVRGDHLTRGERWMIYAPRNAVEQGKKLPLVLVLSEVNGYYEYASSSTYAQYLDYFKLAASGEINLMFFALETPETMDLAATIIKEAEQKYPIDPSRVYVTGHSHDGHLTREFAYRHPELVAAAAPLGNSSGLAAPAYSHEHVIADDARIEAWSKIDMPIITIGAASEVFSPHTMPSSILNDYNFFVEAWQRRLKASRAPMKSREEIIAAEQSDDYVTRLFGLPNDGSWIAVIDGLEHYFIDVKNVDGRKHLRIVGIENMVHTPEPTMPLVAWSFMRRFARDQQTGKVIELY